MASLRDRLAALRVGAAASVAVPELGEGAVVHVRTLTLGERESLSSVGLGGTPTEKARRVREILAVLVCEADGTPAFAGPDDPALALLPGPAADRVIDEGMRANFPGRSGDPKAATPSTPTPNSKSSSPSP